MSESDFSYKSQNVNYLGFLEAQLRDLQGIHTLAYELIQNADDVKDEDGRSQTTWLTFDITDDALIVENDGVFRAVDFERLQNLAGGGKRDEAGTTGAFGIGFIAVYQITDAPEILSNNTHWIIHPDAPAEQRIQERPAETHGTRFYLPWAFNGRSPIRRALRMEAVVPDQLDDFATSFGEAIELAVLFLTQLKTLTVMRNGRLLKQIERIQPQPDQIVLKDETGQQKKWILVQGDFDTEAAQLRHTYTWQIEAKRRSQVRVAVPTEALDRQGRLFAVLPTNDVTPLPFHINADFYPTTDRKRIHFDTGYQAKWNQAAIACAAKMVAEQIGHWQTVLGHVGFWQLLQKMTYTKQMSEENELADVFALFWQMVAPSLRDLPVLYTANQKWILPREGRLFMHRGDETAVSLLTQLQIPIVHPDLTPYHQLMRLPELNTPSLIIDDIAAALMQLKLTKSTDLFTAPPFLRTLDQLKTLWQIIDKLLTRLFAPQENESALQALRSCAIVLTEQMTLERLDRVFQSKPEAKQLFPQVHWLHTAVSPTSFPGNKVQNFGVRQAVELLQEMPIDQLEHSWRMGQLDLPALFRWFESQQIEIFADDPLLQAEIRRLPLCPVGGELRPLTDLYIPGGFDDPLGLAGLLDLDAIGGRSQFLQDLGARELDFDTYVSIQMPHMLAQQLDIPSDARHRLAQLLAKRLGEIRDDLDLQEQLGNLPLIACMDGSFRAASTVYATRDVIPLLGNRVHIAEPVESRAVQALHNWLGVRKQATSVDIVESLLAISLKWGKEAVPLEEVVLNQVMQCWRKLQDLHIEELKKYSLPEELNVLQDKHIIPNIQHVLMPPAQLFSSITSPIRDSSMPSFDSDAIQDVLVLAEEPTAFIWWVIGVKSLSEGMTLQVVDENDAMVDIEVQERIKNRRELVDRVYRAEMKVGETAVKLSILDTIRVKKLSDIQVQYQLTVGDKQVVTERISVSVKWDVAENILYIADQPKTAWAAIAKEIVTGITGQQVGSLTIAIREILTADSAAEASQLLDELGYL